MRIRRPTRVCIYLKRIETILPYLFSVYLWIVVVYRSQTCSCIGGGNIVERFSCEKIGFARYKSYETLRYSVGAANSLRPCTRYVRVIGVPGKTFDMTLVRDKPERRVYGGGGGEGSIYFLIYIFIYYLHVCVCAHSFRIRRRANRAFWISADLKWWPMTSDPRQGGARREFGILNDRRIK